MHSSYQGYRSMFFPLSNGAYIRLRLPIRILNTDLNHGNAALLYVICMEFGLNAGIWQEIVRNKTLTAASGWLLSGWISHEK
jgi:hypothetical protein